jgi:dTDP-4-amino-4,6-dideoxygalactose transaminase/GNAT superfamily N-acetyltransferase
MSIPLFKVFMHESAQTSVQNVLQSGMLTQAEQVDAFESELSEWLDTPYVVTVNSATSGLTLALRLCDLKPGDQVLCTPLTCFATICAILSHGCTIRWVDVNPETCEMDLNDLQQQLSPETRAIVIVHWGGMPMEMNALHKIRDLHSRQYDRPLPIIEDCAHAFGAEYQGRKVGTMGNLSVFSFQAIKSLTTGDGGALICPTKTMYERAKKLRWFGIDRTQSNEKDHRLYQPIEEWGYKFHMNDLNASIGRANLPFVQANLDRAREIARFYDTRLRGVPGVSLVQIPDTSISSWWLYTIRIINLDGFCTFMKERAITVSRVHARCDIHPCVQSFTRPLPQLDTLSAYMVCIPIGWWLTTEEIEFIAASVREWCERYMKIRPLQLIDQNDYFTLLYQLNQYPIEMTRTQWADQYNKIVQQQGIIYVMEHANQLIATAKIFIEYKFAHSIAHIEDVVVHETWRRRGIGSKLVQKLMDLARDQGCYKIVLAAKESLGPFYTRLGFVQTGGLFTYRIEPSESFT